MRVHSRYFKFSVGSRFMLGSLSHEIHAFYNGTKWLTGCKLKTTTHDVMEVGGGGGGGKKSTN